MNSAFSAVFLLSLIAADKPLMATFVPPEVTTPDQVETRLGTLEFSDGRPAPATVEKLYDNLDFVRGVEAYMETLPGASLYAMREGLRSIGVDNQSVAIFETLVDSKSLLLMPDRESVVLLAWVDLHDGPVVVETSPKITGFIDDFWSQHVTDIGARAPDLDRGGKYLLVPPGVEIDVPKGYYGFTSGTYGNWIVARAALVDGDAAPAVENFKKTWRHYPFAQAGGEKPPMKFINASTMAFSTLPAGDFRFFEQVNHIVQEEPNSALSPDTLGLLASIGIERGRPFSPDERLKKTLADAAAVGNATARAILFANRDKSVFLYADSTWEVGVVAANKEFLRSGVRLLDARTRFFYSNTGTTPGMGNKAAGRGSSQYIVNTRDATGAYLDGGTSYTLHLPPKVPAKLSWSIAVHDSQTRSALQTDTPFPRISSLDKGLKQNKDGSIDLYFGPAPPEGMQSNWIQTIPGKGWTTVLRLYEPQVPFFDKSWRPGEIEVMAPSAPQPRPSEATHEQ